MINNSNYTRVNQKFCNILAVTYLFYSSSNIKSSLRFKMETIMLYHQKEPFFQLFYPMLIFFFKAKNSFTESLQT